MESSSKSWCSVFAGVFRIGTTACTTTAANPSRDRIRLNPLTALTHTPVDGSGSGYGLWGYGLRGLNFGVNLGLVLVAAKKYGDGYERYDSMG